MKFRLLIIMLVLVLFNCTYYHMAFKKTGQFFSENEKALLAETTEALTFGYGYDTFVELDYVFTFPYTKQDFKKKVALMHGVLKKYDKDIVAAFYEKIYYLRSLTHEQMLIDQKNRYWKSYTYIKNYLLPAIEEYTALLEQGVIQQDSSFKVSLEERKIALLDGAQKEVAYLNELRVRRNNRKALNGRAPK